MKHLVTAAAVVLTAGLATGLAAGSAAARDQTIQRSVKAGTDTEVWSHSSMRKDCASKAPIIKITQHPSNGVVTVKDGQRKLTGSGDFAKCNGMIGKGAFVHYKPKDGYTGTDTLKYQVTFASGNVLDVTAQLRVGAKDDGDFTPAKPAEPAKADAPKAGDKKD